MSRLAPSAADTFWLTFGEHVPYLCNSLLRLGVPSKDVDDVAHDVLVVAFQSREKFDPRRPLRPWLFGLAFNIAQRFLARHAHARTSLGEVPDRADEEEISLDSSIERQERRARVLRALDALPPEQRAVLLLHTFDEQPIPAVAEALDIPLNTAYSRLRLARQRFEQAYVQLAEGRTSP